LLDADTRNSYSAIKRLAVKYLLSVNRAKAPGYPLNLLYTTNEQAIDADYDLILGSVIARVHLWLSDDWDYEDHRDDPMWFILNGIIDPSSVFIKDEPHPLRKLKEGRFRCITPVSLVGQVVEAILTQEMADSTKESLYDCGSAIGIGFTDHQNREFRDFMYRKLDEFDDDATMTSSDVKGFDALHDEVSFAAVHHYEQLAWLANSVWWRAQKRWYLLMSKSVVFVDGVLYTKTIRGTLDSGSRKTSLENTTLRLIYEFYIRNRMPPTPIFVVAAGDDSISVGKTAPGEYERVALGLNITLRDVTTSRDSVEFCSHRYNRGNDLFPLTSWPKSVYRMLSKAVLDPLDVRQALNEMRHNVGLYTRLSMWVERIAPLTTENVDTDECSPLLQSDRSAFVTGSLPDLGVRVLRRGKTMRTVTASAVASD